MPKGESSHETKYEVLNVTIMQMGNNPKTIERKIWARYRLPNSGESFVDKFWVCNPKIIDGEFHETLVKKNAGGTQEIIGSARRCLSASDKRGMQNKDGEKNLIDLYVAEGYASYFIFNNGFKHKKK